MFRELWASAVGGISSAFRSWQELRTVESQGRTDVRKAEIQADVARAQADATRAQTEQDGNQAWELETVRISQHSLKDEFWTAAAILPIALCFVPGGAPFVIAGFQALSGAPGWFQLLVGASVSYSFGIRQMVNLIRDGWQRPRAA